MPDYVSTLAPGELIIDDDNAPPPIDISINGERKMRGRIPRPWDKEPFGSHPYAKPFDIPVIARDRWAGMIQKMELNKSRVSDHLDMHELTVLDQNGTNFCWANAPVHCVEIVRVMQGHPLVRLSPASVACPIKGYKNQGGWGSQALEYMIKNGVGTQEKWPANKIDRSLMTAAMKEEALNFRVLEWWELSDSRSVSFDQLMTCLLLGIPVAIGLNWWSHEVTAIDPVSLGGGKFGARIDNSWGTQWGTQGRSVLTESKATPDDAVAPRVVVPWDQAA